MYLVGLGHSGSSGSIAASLTVIMTLPVVVIPANAVWRIGTKEGTAAIENLPPPRTLALWHLALLGPVDPGCALFLSDDRICPHPMTDSVPSRTEL
jgi:hypothetical protein